jgi:MFS family permease
VISNVGDGIGTIAYPWLATAVTRNPLLIAMVAVVQRLPWLVVSLPAGVITDRVDRRTLMVQANLMRGVLTAIVALFVLSRQSSLPGPDEVDSLAGSTDVVLYGMILLATLLIGTAEVLYDNTNQTILPSIVDQPNLEKANGRMWSAEQIANTFVGPPLGALLLVAAFSVPFFVDAGTFFVSAALIATLPSLRRVAGNLPPSAGWKADLKEGFSWLWGHDFLRPLAIILGVMNMTASIGFAIMVLFAQEVLDTGPTEFAILMTGGAIGGVIGGWTASAVSNRIGPGNSLALTLLGGAGTTAITGSTSLWPVAWAMSAAFMFVAVLWNVITVSLRQSIIPDHLLGRVNSVYRFFAWGMMPIGSLIGGGVVAIMDSIGSRELALRAPFFVAAAMNLLLAAYAVPKLTTARIEAARATAPDR